MNTANDNQTPASAYEQAFVDAGPATLEAQAKAKAEEDARRAAAEKAEAEERQKRWEAQRLAGLERQANLRRPHLRRLSEDLKTMILARKEPLVQSVEFDEAKARLIIAGVDVSTAFAFEEETRSNGMYGRHRDNVPTGRLIARGYFHGGTNRFIAGKRGFRYDDMANLLFWHAHETVLQAKTHAAREAAGPLVKRMQAEFGVNDYYGPVQLKTSGNASKPVFFHFEIKRSMTEAEVRAALSALQLAGLWKSEKKG